MANHLKVTVDKGILYYEPHALGNEPSDGEGQTERDRPGLEDPVCRITTFPACEFFPQLGCGRFFRRMGR